MKKIHFLAFIVIIFTLSIANISKAQEKSLQEINKEIARNFYEDLWFSDNTEAYSKYVADTYVAHDIGDRKGITEPAIEQKNIADFFWDNGDLACRFDYQIAEGDLVATRWVVDFKPKTILGKLALGAGEIPIINVFRFKDGKIVELWNHRHDIDTGQTRKFVLQGLLIGLLIVLVPTFLYFKLRRKLRKMQEN